MFDEVKKELDSNFDDDCRWEFCQVGSKLYFLQSNHHNDELFVVICDSSEALWSDIATARANATPGRRPKDMTDPAVSEIIKEAMMKNGGVLIGKPG